MPTILVRTILVCSPSPSTPAPRHRRIPRSGRFKPLSSSRAPSLAPTYPALDLDLAPGQYHIRVIGQWPDNPGAAYVDRRYNDVAYEFDLSVPGDVELRAECASTPIGGDITITLASLADPLRTAPDSANHAGCRFNKPIASVSLTLENGARSYTELFHIDPPSLSVGFPLPRSRSPKKAVPRSHPANTPAGSSR